MKKYIIVIAIIMLSALILNHFYYIGFDEYLPFFMVYNRKTKNGFEIGYDRTEKRWELWETSGNVHGGRAEMRIWLR